MTPSDKSAAQTALNAGRATYARLDQIRGPEDTAADLVELWGSAEAAMRSMLGGSSLSGQALVREVRQRGLMNLDQANALVSFADARARVDSVNYKPTLTDVGYARVGYNELVRALDQPTATAASVGNNAGTSSSTFQGTQTMQNTDSSNSGNSRSQAPNGQGTYAGNPSGSGDAAYTTGGSRGRKNSGMMIAAIAAVVVIIAVVGYLMFGRSSYEKDMARAINTMQAGQTESARAQFLRIVGKHPDQSEPHVFLSRLSRNDGDLVTARRELVTVIQREPENVLALREMGMLLLTEGSPDLARKFLVRAIEADSKDLASQGYLGCALIRLGRVQEGQTFLARAGTGNWSSCATEAARQAPVR